MGTFFDWMNRLGLAIFLIGAGYLIFEVYELKRTADTVQRKVEKFDDLTDLLFRQEAEIKQLAGELAKTKELAEKHEAGFEAQTKFNAVVAQNLKPLIVEREMRLETMQAVEQLNKKRGEN